MGKNKKSKLKVKNIYNKKLLLFVSLMFCFMTIIMFCFYNKAYYYPSWSNGEKIEVTNGCLINRFVDDETGDVYSCIEYYDYDKTRIEKWFKIDLSNENNIDVYYVINNPIEQSRLTSPHNIITTYSFLIFSFIFIILDIISIYHYLKIIKNK